MTKNFRQFICDNRSGNALIEFAITLPVLLLMLVGTIESGRYFIINQKLDKVANSMADFTTQATSVSTGDLDAYTAAIPEIMQPFTFSGTVIFSSIAFFNTPQPPCNGTNVDCVSWQYTQLGSAASQIGSPGGNAVLPNGYNVIQGQNIIAVEVTYNFTPLLSGTATIIPAFSPHTLYKYALYKPRQGTLTTLSP